MTSKISGPSPKTLTPQRASGSESSSYHLKPLKRVLESTLSKRKFLDTETQNIPFPLKSTLKDTLNLEQPKTLIKLQPPSGKKVKYAPECIPPAEAGGFNDKPSPRGSKDLCESPCSQRSSKRQDDWKIHQYHCKEVEGVLQGELRKEEIYEKVPDSEQPVVAECTVNHHSKTNKEQKGLTYDITLEDEYHKASEETQPDSEPQKRTFEHDSSKEEDLSNPRSSGPTDEVTPDDAQTNDHGIIQPVKLGRTPLDIEDETYLDGKSTSNPTGLQVGGSQLHERLLEKFTSRLTRKDQSGYVYIFSDPKRPHLHKIGRAKKTDNRLRQIRYSCGLQLELVKQYQVDYYARTEGLIHAYLSDLCQPYVCETCHAKHGEWFEIGNRAAQAYVNTWVKFMCQESPYDKDSKELQPFWKNLVRLQARLFKDLDTGTVREGWDRILSPTTIDRISYKFQIVAELVWKFYWPVNAIVAWTVAFAAIQHPATFAFLAASVIGTFITMAQDFHRL